MFLKSRYGTTGTRILRSASFTPNSNQYRRSRYSPIRPTLVHFDPVCSNIAPQLPLTYPAFHLNLYERLPPSLTECCRSETVIIQNHRNHSRNHRGHNLPPGFFRSGHGGSNPVSTLDENVSSTGFKKAFIPRGASDEIKASSAYFA